jgi:DNA-binding transcriptional MerR regulator
MPTFVVTLTTPIVTVNMTVVNGGITPQNTNPIGSETPMNKLLERLRNDFRGSADALIAKAEELAKALRLEQEASEGNERLLRHYVSIGVVDKPSREGRDALYGFRHLLQFLAARRLLAEGFSLAKIAGYTSVVPTDALSAYLEKPGRTSEAELLVAAFRSEAPARGRSRPAPQTTPGSAPPSRVATGMGMVDVMHEMREMERRVHTQLTNLQQQVHTMVADAVHGMDARAPVPSIDPQEFKRAIGQLAEMMNEAAKRFDDMLRKPMLLIEKQIDQQRYLFEEAHKQKAFLEHMFKDLLSEQRAELNELFRHQAARLEELTVMQRHLVKDMKQHFDRLESVTAGNLKEIENHMQAQAGRLLPRIEQKEGKA